MTADVCRVCEDPTANKNIFSPKNKHIQKKLAACADIELSVLDDLPKFICEKCQDTLNIAYDFKVQVEYTDRKLRSAKKGQPPTDIVTISQLKVEDEFKIETDVSMGSMQEYGNIGYHQETEKLCIKEFNEDELDFPDNESEFGQIVDDNSIDDDITLSPISLKSESEAYHADDIIDITEFNTQDNTAYNLSFECGQYKAENLNPDRNKVENRIDVPTLDSQKKVAAPGSSTKIPKIARKPRETKPERDKKYHCSTCNEPFLSFAELQSHQKSHGAKRFKCEICEKWFVKKYRLQVHLQTHEKREYPCTDCDKKYSNIGNLGRHIRHFHKKEKLYMCSECGLSFNRSALLEQHYGIHIDEKNIPCDQCDKKFKTRHHLVAHKRTHIPVEVRRQRRRKPIDPSVQYVCQYCGKISGNPYLAKNHLRTHTGERPYECTICSKKFAFQQSLNVHMTVHTGERPYKCNQCDAAFKQVGHLNGHILIHTGEKKHECNYCHKTFRLKSSLTIHERLHTGETPYKCPVCDKKYADPSTFRKHKATHGNVHEKPIVDDQTPRDISEYFGEDCTELGEIIEMHSVVEEK